jgi:S1-C subfamily serine protease
LLDREGRIIGTQIRDSRFGGFLYAKSFVAREHWDRMKNGEIWGEWFPATGPMLGIDITSAREGAKVTKVHADSPAQAADVQLGDLVKRIDGQAVASLDDVYRLLATKDPGQEITTEFIRGTQSLIKKIKLMPRLP